MKKIIVALIVFILLFPHVSAQSNGPAAVVVTVNPEVLIRGVPFALTFVIDYPVPDYVSVIAPSFTDALSLERIVKYPWTFGTETRTVVEYRLIANTTGRIILNPFMVYTPQGAVEINPFVLSIENPNPQQRIITHRFSWEGVPGQLAAGERITLTLRASGWNSPQPPPAFFMPEVPQGVILASSAVSPQERADGIALRLTLIPLAPGDFNLPARALQHEATRFEIPALRIHVTAREQ